MLILLCLMLFVVVWRILASGEALIPSVCTEEADVKGKLYIRPAAQLVPLPPMAKPLRELTIV